MPQDRELVIAVFTARRIGQADKMEDERVDSLVRQGVFLVEQYPDEERVGP